MLSGDEFRDRFLERLEAGGEALEEEGFEVESYEVLLLDSRNTIQYSRIADTAQEAWDQIMETIDGSHKTPVPVQGSIINEILSGETEPVNLLSDGLQGGIGIKEPKTEVFWADEPKPAYGRIIRYNPDVPDDYFGLDSVPDMRYARTEKGSEHANKIIEAFEKHGFNAKREEL
jgi:hypothetical protein